MFADVPIAPEDAIFGLANQCKADPNPDKVNLIIGAYRTNEGKPWLLPSVLRAERRILEQLEAGELNHEYLPIDGLKDFTEASMRLALGNDSAAISEQRTAAVQALSGTGALRMALEFLHEFYSHSKTVYVSKPTWGNHKAIVAKTQLKCAEYRYWDPSTRTVAFSDMCTDLEGAEEGAIVILHACAHNPTGCDPSREQWTALAELCQRKRFFTIFDSAYQGFASGSVEKDRTAMTVFADKGLEFFVAQSYSKNFGLYNERCGCVTAVVSSPTAATAVRTQLKKVARPMFSNPPHHGARVVATVLNDETLRKEWYANIETMSSRIRQMRTLLFDELTKLNVPGEWDHILKQIGMFSFTGLTPQQVQYMQDEHHVYLLPNGRANMCAVTTTNAPRVAHAIHQAILNTPSPRL